MGSTQPRGFILNKPAHELDLAEAAVLAAIADNPALDPNEAPEQVMEQQRRILWDMLRLRMIRPQQGVEASREEPVLARNEFQGKTIRISELEPQFAPAFHPHGFRAINGAHPAQPAGTRRPAHPDLAGL